MSEKIQLLEMIKQKNNLNHQICELEFNQKGFNERLKLKNKSYVLFRKTPLGKNTSKFKNTIFKKTIGISKSQFWTLIDNNYLIIIGVMNPISVDEHIYYVYEHNKDIAMKDGYTQTNEYINYILTIKGKDGDEIKELRTIEEYLDGK